MALTPPQQIITLRAACFASPTAAAFFVEPGNAAGLQRIGFATSATEINFQAQTPVTLA